MLRCTVRPILAEEVHEAISPRAGDALDRLVKTDRCEQRWNGSPDAVRPGGHAGDRNFQRLYIENAARYMTATLMCAADTQNPRTTAVTFFLAVIVSSPCVMTRRTVQLVETSCRSARPGITGEMVLMELLDAVSTAPADILERAGGDMDTISHAIFEPRARAHRPRQAISTS